MVLNLGKRQFLPLLRPGVLSMSGDVEGVGSRGANALQGTHSPQCVHNPQGTHSPQCTHPSQGPHRPWWAHTPEDPHRPWWAHSPQYTHLSVHTHPSGPTQPPQGIGQARGDTAPSSQLINACSFHFLQLLFYNRGLKISFFNNLGSETKHTMNLKVWLSYTYSRIPFRNKIVFLTILKSSG